MNTEKENESLEDFIRQLELLGTNLIRASLYLALNEKVERSLQKRAQQEITGSIFLIEANYALGDAGILLLCKIYDQDKDSIGLNKILNISESDHRYWNLSDNDAREMKKHISNFKETLNNSDLVKRLILLRNQVIAHPGKNFLKRDKAIVDKVEKAIQPLDPCKDRESFFKKLADTFRITDAAPYENKDYPHFLSRGEIQELIDLAIQVYSGYEVLVNSDKNAEISLNTEIECEIRELVTEFEQLVNKLES